MRYPFAAAAVPPDGIEPMAMLPMLVLIPGWLAVGDVVLEGLVVDPAMVLGVYFEAGLVGYTEGLLPAIVAGSGFLFQPKRLALGIFQPL